MPVIPLRAAASSLSWPLLMLLDCQSEYLADGRAYHLPSAESALKNCASLLTTARLMRLPVAHFRITLPGYFFNEITQFSQWVEPLRPHGNEYVYKRSLPSCFSSSAFSDLTASIDNPQFIIAGLTGAQSCLSTMIDCFHRGYSATFVHDCSASASIGDLSEQAVHDQVTCLMSLYGRVSSLSEITAQLQAARSWSSTF
jgi:nicotinamidase-related amidase